MTRAEQLRAVVAQVCPLIRNVWLAPGPCAHVESEPVPGSVLVDGGWLAERVDDTARRWACADPKVAATLWWYSASATIVAPAAASLLVTGLAPDPDPRTSTLTLRRDGHVGYLARVAASEIVEGPAAYGRALREAVEPVIDALTLIGRANPRSLWSVLGDSLAARLLTAADWTGAPPDADTLLDLALSITTDVPAMPRPRYGSTPRGDYVRRGSCCLIYQVDGHGRCENCPRQTPQQRTARVTASHPA